MSADAMKCKEYSGEFFGPFIHSTTANWWLARCGIKPESMKLRNRTIASLYRMSMMLYINLDRVKIRPLLVEDVRYHFCP